MREEDDILFNFMLGKKKWNMRSWMYFCYLPIFVSTLFSDFSRTYRSELFWVYPYYFFQLTACILALLRNVWIATFTISKHHFDILRNDQVYIYKCKNWIFPFLLVLFAFSLSISYVLVCIIVYWPLRFDHFLKF